MGSETHEFVFFLALAAACGCVQPSSARSEHSGEPPKGTSSPVEGKCIRLPVASVENNLLDAGHGPSFEVASLPDDGGNESGRALHVGIEGWRPSTHEDWRPALEGYVSSVRLGKPAALATSRRSFGSYLVNVHNRIHRMFAEEFLSSLDALPATHPMNDNALFTRLEVVLDGNDGHIVKMGVVRSSGILAFDIAALESMRRASPFGRPPREMLSADCLVYFLWDLHRDPTYACSTINARAFLLTEPPPINGDGSGTVLLDGGAHE